MDIIIKVSDINGAVISKNLLLLLDTIKAGIFDAKITAGTRGLDFDTVDNRLIMVGIFIKIMTKIDL
jgi:hypothetical protein